MFGILIEDGNHPKNWNFDNLFSEAPKTTVPYKTRRKPVGFFPGFN